MTNCPDEVNILLNLEETVQTYIGIDGKIGSQGSRGLQGQEGDAGPPGPPGSVGDIGPKGLIGQQGDTGAPGITGLVGDTGLIGPIGVARTWFLSGGTSCNELVNFTGAREPIAGDLLINLEDCSLCEYTLTGWESTNQIMKPCVSTTNLAQCLKDLNTVPDTCTFTLTLSNCPPIFGSNTTYVSEILLFGESQTLPAGTFKTPTELGNLLETVGWQYMSAMNTYLYLISQSISVPVNFSNESSITFQGSTKIKIVLQHQCESETCYACQNFKKQSYLLTYNEISQTGLSQTGLSQTGLSQTELAWVSPDCLGITGLRGPQGVIGSRGQTGNPGLQGPSGPSGPEGPDLDEVCGCLTSMINTNLTDCQFLGVISPSCLNFLNNPNMTMSIATYYDTHKVLGPTVFSNQIELNIALSALSIIISGNLIEVTTSPELINKIIFYNASAQEIISIPITSTQCCPSGKITGDLPILSLIGATSGTGCMRWIPAECIIKPDFDLEEEICRLPPYQEYRCCVQIDATDIFITNNPQQPWKVHEIILFNKDLTANYNSIEINDYQDWINLLQDNGWSLVKNTLSVYQYCEYRSSPVTSSTSITNHLTMIDSTQHIFYCNDLDLDCEQLDPNSIQIIVKDYGLTGLTGYDEGCTGLTGLTGGLTGVTYGFTALNDNSSGFTGVHLALPSKFLDTIGFCSDVCYACLTTVQVDDFVSKITISAPWQIEEIMLSLNQQPIISTQFTSALQFQSILTMLNWLDLGGGTFGETVIQPIPSEISYIKLTNNLGKTQTILLTTKCTANCQNTNTNRYIFTRLDEGQYCWMNPNCFNDPLLNIECCGCTAIDLNKIEDCHNIIPKYDLRLEISQSLLDLIKIHFTSSGPFWVYGYKIKKVLEDGTIKIEDKILEEKILQPFNLKNLALTLEKLEWYSNPDPTQITGDTKKLQLIFNNSDDIIMGVYINRFGEDGYSVPLNYLIPLHTIDRIECHNLPNDAMILLKNGVDLLGLSGTICYPLVGTGATAGSTDGHTATSAPYCFTDLHCVVPYVPPPINFEKELCALFTCDTLCDGYGLPDQNPTGITGYTGPTIITGCGSCYESMFSVTGPSGITGLTGICIYQEVYNNCIHVDIADANKINDQFGPTGIMQIVEYHTVEGNICTLEPPMNIGVNPTFEQLIDAFLALGWTSEDLTEIPTVLMLLTCRNIKYVVINLENHDPDTPPYPYFMGSNCITENFCPSTNPENYTLIKKPDKEMCWTKICRIAGVRGFTGPVGITGPNPPGATGNIGHMGNIGQTGPTGLPGPYIGITGAQGPTGSFGEFGAQGPQGPTGIIGDTGVVGETGNVGVTGIIGPTGLLGLIGNQGPIGFQGITGPIGILGDTGVQGLLGPTGLIGFMGITGIQGEVGAVDVAGSQGPQGNIGPTGQISGPLGPTGSIGPFGNQGETGISGPSIIDVTGLNLGSGDGLPFIDVTNGPPTILNFREISPDENIGINQIGNDIFVRVTDQFDWSDTRFQGSSGFHGNTGASARVLAGSSLTFNSGSILFTNQIEETSADVGVTIDTSNTGGINYEGTRGVLFKDGGIQLENITRLGTGPTESEGMTLRADFLDIYQYGCFDVDWTFSDAESTIITSNFPIPWQRIGNQATIYIDTITTTPSTRSTTSSASAVIDALAPGGGLLELPNPIKPGIPVQLYLLTYDTRNPDQGFSTYRTSTLRLSVGLTINSATLGGSYFPSTALSGGAGFSNSGTTGTTDYFSNNHPQSFTYFVSNSDGDYCLPFP